MHDSNKRETRHAADAHGMEEVEEEEEEEELSRVDGCVSCKALHLPAHSRTSEQGLDMQTPTDSGWGKQPT